MKTSTFYLIAISILTLFIFEGCKKDSNTVVNSKMTATIDDEKWSSITTSATDGVALSIRGVSESGDYILISIFDGLDEGTYILDQYSFSVGVYEEGGAGYTTNATSSGGGKVIVTDVDYTDHTISGTFSFDVVGLGTGDIKSINDGVFTEIQYTID